MDGREAMALSGSSPYYMHRGISGIHGQAGVRPISNTNPNLSAQSGGISSSGGGSNLPIDSSSNMGMPTGMANVEPVRRKRGRPRKYGPDGSVALALSPLSSSAPGPVGPLQKRGRGRPPGSGKKQQLASLGEWLANSAGMAFTPHIITISIGEDIASKIMSFSQQGPRAVCILSANGAVSTVTLRQPSTSGGTVTYEGRFEILCLSGSYMLTESGGSRNRTGGLSVSLASPDGRVVGGGVAGLLLAASPVQVIVGSFIYGRKSQPKSPSTEPLRQGRPGGTPGSGISGQDSGMGAGASISPLSQNPMQNPPSGWPGSQSMDLRNTDINIDLTRG
ncbi:hypothetical protein AMTRI_Chr07g30610 [Amborella trichopoda]|uniref:AT-hook motif nuclear-localized protein n=1 Tax=Amborella trichopoda TaxID=13333 RepID=W1NHY4_AMBTC|nr:AT-hook motif nuclear-localized protein 9 [Amborella trichopoda]XP_020525584.1 AT-hook motif nuclear-localized protein 9 [Amborella trichopoda]XP_020525590.1 AT-hook motif nuclear-localized protein 9 [Amborella trichopoda]XP_020525591.1 AT-hook motif nuclear-localized protein 9 [Amborella trichopoda]XP_020525597.1 AT-hook motif nuclear-localized protein 9 [Amborella trichopoda]XP_020525602.1 AT-hook motif nuclear-localized protein 9 [Amborella trichopoda]XP_020525608.1 AT-hook motif nuclea|eukprot:XP_006827670.1 AT-hook motif nuclear-localized protein 9 [Amborella trichopoda]